MAGAGRRAASFSHWRGPGLAGADCRHPTIFDDSATLDLLLNHLQCHERWLPDRSVDLRLRPADVGRTWSSRFLRISSNDLSHTVFGSPRVRDTASADDLFSATRSGSDT